MLDPRALTALKKGQRQIDQDGVEVGVSRQALDELIAEYERLSQPEGKAEAVAWQRKHPTEGWSLVHECDIPYYKRKGQEIRALYAQPSGQTAPSEKSTQTSDIAKLLVWYPDPGAFPCPTWGAQSPFGRFIIEEVSASDSPAYEVRYTPHHLIAIKDSLDEAKEAAQSDYETRIRSALQPSGQTRAEIIEECAKVAEWAHMVPPDGGSPTEEERAVAEAAARNIRALAAQGGEP